MSQKVFHEIVNVRTGEVLARQATLATSMASRAVGLLGKKMLQPEEALVIRPCWSIHTLFMRFRLDVIFLAKDGTVKKIVRRMPTYRFAAARGAHDTIEMAPGALEGADLLIGDLVEIRPASTPRS